MINAKHNIGSKFIPFVEDIADQFSPTNKLVVQPLK